MRDPGGGTLALESGGAGTVSLQDAEEIVSRNRCGSHHQRHVEKIREGCRKKNEVTQLDSEAFRNGFTPLLHAPITWALTTISYHDSFLFVFVYVFFMVTAI